MNRLPQVLVDYIWSFDNRYKIQYQKCVDEMKQYFFRNRLKIRLKHDYFLFDNNKANGFGYCYYQYILKRISMFGDCIPDENLNHLKISSNKIVIV